jgi:hypothetical protein
MEFDIAGNTYRAGKMDTFKQFHVSRRLAPVLGGLAAVAGGDVKDFTAFLQPIADAIARMSDADCDFILQSCLGVVQRQQGNAWSPVFAGAGKALMFDDIDLGVMLQIAVQVIQDNLGGFFQGGAAALNTPAPTAA